jgi:hypothetical protein
MLLTVVNSAPIFDVRRYVGPQRSAKAKPRPDREDELGAPVERHFEAAPVQRGRWAEVHKVSNDAVNFDL